MIKKVRLLVILIVLVSGKPCILDAKDITLTIHLRGVYSSDISLMTTNQGNQLIETILSRKSVLNGDTAILHVPAEFLPGEFVLRFDYKEKASSSPYPAEKNFIINHQELELWVHPIYSNNADSTWFQDGEAENNALTRFMTENYAQKEMVGMLQNFLVNYDDDQSEFYQEGVREYERRRKAHNQWISDQLKHDRDLFVSTLYNFQYVPEMKFEGPETERRQSLKDHYFDYIDFNDSLLIRTRDFKSWMDQYVNLYGEDATTASKRDSLFTLAGRNAVEKARTGHPVIYGWMVDYFYKGYESFNIQPGIAMLAPYLDDPDCLTSKRQAILKRLEGMKTLVKGTIAPDFNYTDVTGKQSGFLSYTSDTPYKLVLFWSADCPHCMELVSKLYNWWDQPENGNKLTVFALSLDDTETEVAEYHKVVKSLTGWQHILTKGGVNSPEANSYFILATPVMILVDAQSNEIVSMPENLGQLESALK